MVGLKKKDLDGPSQCPLCLSEEESMNHLLNGCPFSSSLWDRGAIIFRRSDKVRGQPDQTLKEWNLKAFKNLILGMIWIIFPWMLLWAMWKERNSHIFRDKKSNEEEVWKRIVHNLQEMVRNKQQGESDKDFTEVEA